MASILRNLFQRYPSGETERSSPPGRSLSHNDLCQSGFPDDLFRAAEGASRNGSTRPSGISSTSPYQLPLQLPFLQLLEQQSLLLLHESLLPPHVTH